MINIPKYLSNNLKLVIKEGKFINGLAKIIYTKYIKNLIKYLESINEKSLLFALNLFKNTEIIFPFKYISRKFLKTIIYIWSKNEDIMIKIKSFLILK